MNKYKINFVIIFTILLLSQVIPAYLTYLFVQNNLGDDFYIYKILNGIKVKEIDYGAVFLLFASMSIPSIIIALLILLGFRLLK